MFQRTTATHLRKKLALPSGELVEAGRCQGDLVKARTPPPLFLSPHHLRLYVFQLPATLAQWRSFRFGGPLRPRWTPLEQFFASEGFTLFVGPDRLTVPWDGKPRIYDDDNWGLKGSPRAPDQYHHWIPVIKSPYSQFFIEVRVLFRDFAIVGGVAHLERTQKPIHVPARSREGKDVLIRIVAKGEEGREHLKILRTLARDTSPENHALPLLAVLEKDDMAFAVFPLITANMHLPWYYTVAEVFQFVREVLEVRPLAHLFIQCAPH